MSPVAAWLEEIVHVVVASGPYLLLGLVVAGWIRGLVPRGWVERHLGRDDRRSIVKAALVGAPVPLCSCSVLPAATALRRQGASRGATASFLVATPETGVDSIGVSWALLDPLMTVVRPLAAIVTAIATGLAVRRFGGGDDDARAGAAAPGGEPAEGHEHEHGHGHGHGPHPGEDHDHDHDHAPGGPRRGLAGHLREGVVYAFGPLLADLAPWLLLGFGVSAALALVVPAGFFGETFPNGLPAMLAMLVIGLPTYVCATASTPVAAALVAKGLAPGAALVLLLAGPATNVATIGVVGRLLGRRALVAYLLSISLASIAFGLAIDAAYPLFGADPREIGREWAEHHGPLSRAAAWVTGAALLWHAVRARLDQRAARALWRWCGALVPAARGASRAPAPLYATLCAVALAAWASTATTQLAPGEVATLARPGADRELRGPERAWHLPWPLARVHVRPETGEQDRGDAR